MLKRLSPLLPPALLLLVWQVGATSGAIPDQVLPPPADVARAAAALWSTSELGRHLEASLGRLVGGYALGATTGLGFGVAIGLSAAARALFAPLFMALRQVPVLSFMPLLVLLLGIEEPFKIAIVAITSFFPVALAAFDAVRDAPRSWFDVARVYRIPPAVFLLRILGPGTAPAILTGLRIALTRAWLVLVAAELLAADSGIGQMMEMGRQLFRLDVVLVGVVLSGLIGFALDVLMRRAEARLLRWRAA
jgi:sulfonate transport system permease protein